MKMEQEQVNDNIIGFCWFKGGDICIMIAHYPDEGNRGLIYSMPSGRMSSEEKDLQSTYDWGSSFPIDLAIQCIDRFGGWLKPEKEKWQPKIHYGPLKLNLKSKADDE